VLDDGRLTDNKGRTVDFKNTIIIMTSNAGSHIIQKNMEDASDENEMAVFDRTRLEIFKYLKSTIRPEFLNRIDEIILFKPLTKEEIRDVVKLQFGMLQKMLAKNNISIHATDTALDHIAAMGYDPQYGARPIKRIIQKNILNELSKMILAGNLSKNSSINLDWKQDKIIFVNQS
jgi:ATP-dependent Clp protease ATP-binding subunit ClpB